MEKEDALGGPLDQLANFLLNYLGPAPKKYREVFLSPLSSLEPIRVPPSLRLPSGDWPSACKFFLAGRRPYPFKAGRRQAWARPPAQEPRLRPQEFTCPQHNGCIGETLGR